MSLESLPVGLRFRPTDEELINHYLWGKINGHESAVKVIAEIDLCKWEPWDLPNLAEKSVTRPDDSEWFFFALVDRKYPTGNRSNRATTAGYWKATGKDRMIKSGKKSIGSKKTLVFHIGRAPDGERTTWIMHEYRTNENSTDCMISGQPAYVLCRIFYKPDEKKSSNSNSKEMDQISFSPSTTKSSPDNSAHHAEDVEEQFQNTTSNQPTPDSNMIENPQILPDPTGNQPDAFAWMQEDEFYGSTSAPLVTEEKEGYSISEEMRLLIDGPRNERLDLLSQIHTGIGPSHMDLSSYNDHKDIHMGQPLGVTMEQDLYPDPHVTEFLNDEGFINHDEYLCIRPYETGACLKGGHNEGTNSGSLPSVGLDVSSVTSTETTHNLVNIAEESTDRKNPASSSNDHELTGARQPQNPTISQGFAPRRLRLQTKIQMGSLAFKGAKPSRDETENEAKSAIKEALEDFKDNPTAGTRLPGLVDADQLGNFDNHGGSLVNQQCNLTLRLRTNRNDEMHRKQEGLSQLPEASNARIPYVSTVYVALCITVLLIVFVGVWGGMLLS